MILGCGCCAAWGLLRIELLLGLALVLIRLLREGKLLNLFQASCVHIDDALGELGVARGALCESHLASIDEVPALILVVVLRLKSLLA